MSNRQLEDMQEEFANQRLAEILGISYDELCELDWEIDTNESNDGLIYEYVISFSELAPKRILDKIGGLEEGNSIRLLPSDLEDSVADDEL